MEDNKKESLLEETPIIGDELEKRKKKFISFLNHKKDWVYYIILAFIVMISVYIRTRNIPRLKDITTGTWTLGPDLDPFLFLRWTEHIVKNGSLMIHDSMRYVPLGYDTAGEMNLLSYMIAWFHNIVSFFNESATVTYSAIWFPVFMAAITAIAFFLFARKIFYKEDRGTKNIIALIATAFFILIPSLLPRTIAGIPEKESAAFFFIFMAFYFFLEGFTSETLKRGLIFGVLAGIMTGALALIWGGALFVFLTIPLSFFLAFFFGKIKKERFFVYSTWMITSFALMMPFSTRYTLENLITSTSTGSVVGIFFVIGISLIIIKFDKLEEIRRKTKLPKELFSAIISILVLLAVVLIIFGPSMIQHQVSDVKTVLIKPMTSRFGLTVAENRQPYFKGEWDSSFGPVYYNIPLYFWLLFIGSITLFYNMVKQLKNKPKIILTLSYFVFMICLIFSRYSPSSILNGENNLSITVYFGGWIIFLGSWLYFYYKIYNEGEFHLFSKFNFSYILYFIILTLGIIGARGGVRLVMVLGAISPIAVSFLVVKISKKYLSETDEAIKVFAGLVALMIIISSAYTLFAYYKSDKGSAESFAPSPYNWQWQKAMAWVRENTSENAVFAHWWDYGYWLQSIGKRATILDGGNAIAYWDHLMGRYVLTGDDEKKALEFLYTHNGTHLLIDSTDIGKYTAFSSIGSDVNYDRFSWIPTFLIDEKQTQETNNATAYLYNGGTSTDEDIVWKEDGNEIFLPKKKAGVGAIIIRKNQNNEIMQPNAIFVYNGKQYNLPLRFAYFNNKLYDFNSGLDAGVFIFPKLDIVEGSKINANDFGALMYLSRRTVHSQLANLYLFNQDSDYFKIVHVESSLFVNDLKTQGLNIGELIYYNGIQGPIKIWEIKYPSNIKLNPDYLSTDYPEEISTAKIGEY